MAQALWQLLEYPRDVMKAHIMLSGCAQHGIHDQNCHECVLCHEHTSCKWIQELAGNLSEERQVSFLEYALDNMISHVGTLDHKISTCSCSSCLWISNAMQTYSDVLIKNDNNEYEVNPPL